MLDLTKTYRTRDGQLRNIKLERTHFSSSSDCALRDANNLGSAPRLWCADGRYFETGPLHKWDLIAEDEPGVPSSDVPPAPFRYDDCPVIKGQRIAEDQKGRKYVLLCDKAPGIYPVIGYLLNPAPDDDGCPYSWTSAGTFKINETSEFDLRVPVKPKRVWWVNLYLPPECTPRAPAPRWHRFETKAEADQAALGQPRVNDMAIPIEIAE